jgi:hypothetical protein
MAEKKTRVQPPLPLMIAAIVGIGGAVLTMLAWRGEKAKKLYLSHCDVALANPRFSSPDLAKLDLKAKTFDGSAEVFERYEWYVARLVYSLDAAMRQAPFQQWRAVTQTQLATHKQYFASDYYAKQDYLKHYSPRMRRMILKQRAA